MGAGMGRFQGPYFRVLWPGMAAVAAAELLLPCFFFLAFCLFGSGGKINQIKEAWLGSCPLDFKQLPNNPLPKFLHDWIGVFYTIMVIIQPNQLASNFKLGMKKTSRTNLLHSNLVAAARVTFGTISKRYDSSFESSHI